MATTSSISSPAARPRRSRQWQSKDQTRKPGEVMWSGPVTHDTTNTGKTAVKTVVIELKK